MTEFMCEKCDFKCNKLSNYNKHIETNKHLKSNTVAKVDNLYKCKCSKIYKHSSTLYHHRKNCRVYLGLSNTKKDYKELYENGLKEIEELKNKLSQIKNILDNSSNN